MINESTRTLSSRKRRAGDRNTGLLQMALYQTGMILLVVLLLGLASSGEMGKRLEPAFPFLYALLLLWSGVHLGALFFSVRAQRAYGQVRGVLDLLFCLTFVWWTGGVESFFLPILFAYVLASSTMYGVRRALIIASTATLVLTVMTVCRVMGWSPTEWMGVENAPVQGREAFLASCLIGQGLAIHAIAILGARLMGGLRRAQRLNALIVRHISDGILVLDYQGRIRLMNDEAVKLLGGRPGEGSRGCRPDRVLSLEASPEILKHLERPTVGDHLLEEEGRALSLVVRRFGGERKNRDYWLFRVRDLTPERRMAAAEERIRGLEELEDLSLGLVHEIRNPLASIRGCMQELGSSRLSPDQIDRLKRIVMRESDRLDRIVDEFMEYSRTEPTKIEPVSLAACLGEVYESLRERQDARRLSFRLDLPDGERIETRGQRELIYRVFLNLGINAIEASSDGGTITIRVVRSGPELWEIQVRDEGHGIDPETRRRIFNPFYTTKPREGGLGLALVEKIVHSHGGSLSVESEVGRGSCFHVWLPASSADSAVERSKELVGAPE